MRTILLYCILLFTSCTVNKGSILALFDRIEELNGDTLSPEVFLGNAYQIIKVDSFFLIVDPYEGFLMTVANISTGEIKRTLRIGQGPNDLLQSIEISQLLNDSILNILETSTNSIVKFNINDVIFGQSPTIIEKITFDYEAGRLQESEDCFFALGYFENGLIGSYNKNGQKLKEHFEYPGKAAMYENPQQRSYAYQSNIKISPDGRKMVQAGVHTDLLCFYRIDKSDITEVKRYFFNDPNVIFQLGLDLSDIKEYFISIHASNDKIYTIYKGFSDNERKNQPMYVLCFDWDGQPLKAYKINNNYLYSICTNEAETELYLLSTEDNGAIIKYIVLHK